MEKPCFSEAQHAPVLLLGLHCQPYNLHRSHSAGWDTMEWPGSPQSH